MDYELDSGVIGRIYGIIVVALLVGIVLGSIVVLDSGWVLVGTWSIFVRFLFGMLWEVFKF